MPQFKKNLLNKTCNNAVSCFKVELKNKKKKLFLFNFKKKY